MKRFMKYYREQKGITLVLIALMLAVLLFFLGMAVDISYMYHVKNQLQVAADAAALAGAANLDGSLDNTLANVNQQSARQQAWKFACKNRAANQSVYLSTNTPSDCDTTSLPPYSSLNGANGADGDIVVGYWSATCPSGFTCGVGAACEPAGSGYFCRATGSTGLAINALKARPQMTGETGTPMPKARVFVGQVFRLIGIDWSRLNARASAIAAPGQLLDTPALSICIKTCNITGLPKLLAIQPSAGLPCGADFGIAWTIFKSDSSIPEKDIEDLIDGTRRLTASDISTLCNQCVTTNNGTSAINHLGDKFRDTTFDADNKDIVGGIVTAWRVGIVILDYRCPTGPGDPCQGCPPSNQGGPNEPYHIQLWAKVTIYEVCDYNYNKNKPNNDHGNNPQCTDKGVIISTLTCVDCANDPLSILSSGQTRLVK